MNRGKGTSIEVQKQLNETAKSNQKPYDERYQRAIDAGMSADRAKQYASSSFESQVTDSAWDKFLAGFGAKTSRQKDIERLNAEDEAFFNSLLNADYEEKYNSAASEAERMRDAGINPNLSESPLPAGDASQIDDTTLSRAGDNTGILGSQPGPGDVVQKLVDIGVGLASFVAGGVDLGANLLSLDVTELEEIFGLASKGLQAGTIIPGLGQFTGTVNAGDNEVWYNFYTPEFGNYATDDPVGYFKQRYAGKLRTKRGRRIATEAMRGMFGLAGDASRTGYKKEVLGNTLDNVNTSGKLGAFGIQGSMRDEGVYRSFETSEAYVKFQSIIRDAYTSELQFQADELKFSSDYYKAMNQMRLDGKSPAEIKAAAEAYNLEKKSRQDAFQSSVFEEITDYTEQLSQLAEQGDESASLMLFFLMNPGLSGLYGTSGNGVELATGGTPYQMVGDVFSGVGDIVKFLRPKTLMKGAANKPKPMVKPGGKTINDKYAAKRAAAAKKK